MLMMRALWGPPWRRKKPRKKKPFTGGTRGSAALASGLILLRRRPEASKAIPGTTRAKRSAFARSFGDLALPDFRPSGTGRPPPPKARNLEPWHCLLFPVSLSSPSLCLSFSRLRPPSFPPPPSPPPPPARARRARARAPASGASVGLVWGP